MAFSVLPHIRQRILASYEENMARYPQPREAVEAYLQGREETFCLCLQYLYGYMPANDALSFGPESFASFVEATLEAYETIPYMAAIPQEIFFPYVLFHRVNSECLDGSRAYFMEQLLPWVEGKTMERVALAVNYWCYAHATYAPADDRTLGPLAVLRGTRGRCGEESVLAVSALRSVGIPARQLYCPRWSHCDDNHAWVEFWADGAWHYLGACEPEAQPDRGWFTSAASKAMLIHTHCWADFGPEPALSQTPLRHEISRTAHYAKTRKVQVRVLQEGKPVAGVRVDFQIVNYAEFFTLHSAQTDEHGLASFETGLGDLCVSVGQRLEKLTGDSLTLDLGEFSRATISFDLVPPLGRYDVELGEPNAAHTANLAQCQAHLRARRASFADSNIAGNAAQIDTFLKEPTAQKQALLGSLSAKDLVDITAETLCDALSVENRYSEELYNMYILPPRVRLEMLGPERGPMRALFPNGFAAPEQILSWMEENLQIVENFGVDNYDPSPLGCLRNRQVPEGAFDLVFVALCRAFGFPARLAPHTGVGQWLDGAGKWHAITREAASVLLTLENPGGKSLNYAEHFTLGRWNGSDFVTLSYPGQILTDRWELEVEPGLYRIITVTRQIDGTASVWAHTFPVKQDANLRVEVPEDQTAQKLKREPLALPAGPLAAALSDMAGQKGLLILAEPGAEPTEHLLQEMLECAQGYRDMHCPIHIFVAGERDLENPTLQSVCRALPQVSVAVAKDPAGEKQLHYKMQVGDLRLPFVVTVDKNGHGAYAAANYNIRMAKTLLQILSLLE